MVMTMKVTVFWDVSANSQLVVYTNISDEYAVSTV
jgi:hypothetical protein